VPSILRGFSAPVVLAFAHRRQLLRAQRGDAFNNWGKPVNGWP
jgi:hypothetical protein